MRLLDSKMLEILREDIKMGRVTTKRSLFNKLGASYYQRSALMRRMEGKGVISVCGEIVSLQEASIRVSETIRVVEIARRVGVSVPMVYKIFKKLKIEKSKYVKCEYDLSVVEIVRRNVVREQKNILEMVSLEDIAKDCETTEIVVCSVVNKLGLELFYCGGKSEKIGVEKINVVKIKSMLQK